MRAPQTSCCPRNERGRSLGAPFALAVALLSLATMVLCQEARGADAAPTVVLLRLASPDEVTPTRAQ